MVAKTGRPFTCDAGAPCVVGLQAPALRGGDGGAGRLGAVEDCRHAARVVRTATRAAAQGLSGCSYTPKSSASGRRLLLFNSEPGLNLNLQDSRPPPDLQNDWEFRHGNFTIVFGMVCVPFLPCHFLLK